jgi:hypothetical protein
MMCLSEEGVTTLMTPSRTPSPRDVIFRTFCTCIDPPSDTTNRSHTPVIKDATSNCPTVWLIEKQGARSAAAIVKSIFKAMK